MWTKEINYKRVHFYAQVQDTGAHMWSPIWIHLGQNTSVRAEPSWRPGMMPSTGGEIVTWGSLFWENVLNYQLMVSALFCVCICFKILFKNKWRICFSPVPSQNRNTLKCFQNRNALDSGAYIATEHILKPGRQFINKSFTLLFAFCAISVICHLFYTHLFALNKHSLS